MRIQNPLNLTLDKTSKSYWGELAGSSTSLAIASTIQQNNSLTVVITPDIITADQLEAEILSFTQEPIKSLQFPDWEILPYDRFSPHQDIVSKRLEVLYQLPKLTRGLLIVPITTLLQRTAPPTFIQQNSLVISIGDALDITTMRKTLTECAYRSVNQVMEHGEFAIRGSILDVFPMGSQQPYRIELFDEDIESIRTFDPDTQCSIDTIDKINLLPAREFPLTKDSISVFRENWRSEFSGNPMDCSLYESVSNGLCPAGIEYYLPLFFNDTASLFDYLPKKAIIVSYPTLETQLKHYINEIKHRYEQRCHDVTQPILKPDHLFLRIEEFFSCFNQFKTIITNQEAVSKPYAINVGCKTLPDITINNKAKQPLEKLERFQKSSEYRLLFCAESLGRREIICELLRNLAISPKHYESWYDFLNSDDHYGIIIAPVNNSFILPTVNIAIICEAQLFGQTATRTQKEKHKALDPDTIIRNLVELNIGDPVVHIDHGVGRYLGLQVLTLDSQESEFLTLEYADKNKLYVPVASLHVISRYSGADLEHAPLHHLGSQHWQKLKQKASKRIHDVAAELLAIYAERESRKGQKITAPGAEYYRFANEFPFEETEDQKQAIDSVIQDLTHDKPMDRLVCGDVGFGKTEVAIRAAFLVVQSGKQVAILVPTTLLAQQHYQTMQDRFASWPIQVEMISRFRTTKEQKTIIEQLAQGKIDILIGTHKLLQSSIKFDNLGLAIIDEEHRFGVRQKERLKALRAEVDILTLTATPIPRTLNMAISSIRELSIIATPPAKRLSIKTFVHNRDDLIIREAILREVMRGGQVYFLHNNVSTIEKIATQLRELIPEAKIQYAHGQQREHELENTMSDFYHQRFNVLVCTTIIETGIDIPTANTIIIDRADRFGLAQLHQLRGRVGRSHHQAYAYLLIPGEKLITKDASKRLEAICSLEDLGAGFTLATHDLEIRGAGELLGDEQSGHIQEIGFSLYMELLERAVKSLKAGKKVDLNFTDSKAIDINLHTNALIPEDYLPDVHSRLILYKRIANANNKEALRALRVEMIDRFGLLPEPVKHLFSVTEIKQLAEPLGLAKIDLSAKGGYIDFIDKPNINPQTIIGLIQQYPKQYQFAGQNRLRLLKTSEHFEERIDLLTSLLTDVFVSSSINPGSIP